MGRIIVVVLVCGCLLGTPQGATADDAPSPGVLVESLRFDPSSPAAGPIVEALGRMGPAGWRRLGDLVVELEAEGDLPVQAARALARGWERDRLDAAARAYGRTHRDDVRAELARGLTAAYPRHADVVHGHLLRAAPGALDVLRRLGDRLPEEILEQVAGHEPLTEIVAAIRGGRTPEESVLALLPRARALAADGLDPQRTRAFTESFARAPSRALFLALVEILREDDADRRDGAQCLLLAASGRDLEPDPAVWRSWIDGKRDDYLVPDAVSPGAVAAAVLRAKRHLLADLEADGSTTQAYKNAGDSRVGSTALTVLALRAAGVPRDHPAVARAVEGHLLARDAEGRPGVPPFSRRYETYTLALLAMAWGALGDPALEEPLSAVRDRLVSGRLENGQWTYTCETDTGSARPATGDNSNTQYANLGLRAIRAAGVEVGDDAWTAIEGFWRGTQQEDGAWGYRPTGSQRRRSAFPMTAGGIAGLAMATEGLHGSEAPRLVGEDDAITRGLGELGRHLLLSDLHGVLPYTLYAVERAAALTGTTHFSGGGVTLDWYREGAWRLLGTQHEDGSWGTNSIRSWERDGFGKAPDTAWSILFLTKATRTLAGAREGRVVPVPVTLAEVDPPPPHRAPETSDPPARLPWRRAENSPLSLTLADDRLSTATGIVTVRGAVAGPVTRVRVGDAVAATDEDGSFAVPVPVESDTTVDVVVEGTDGSRRIATIDLVVDKTAPGLELVGGTRRPPGKQRVEIRADEPIAGVRVGRHYFPASGSLATCTVDLDPNARGLTVTAYDHAGLATRRTFVLDVANRVLVLDGKSAVRVDLPEKPERFTLECWWKGAPLPARGALVADTQSAGIGLFLREGDGGIPDGLVHGARDYLRLRGPGPVRVHDWVHVALTYDGTRATLWIDGVDVASGEVTKHRRSSHPLVVGAEPGPSGRTETFLTGTMDDVRLSDVVRYDRRFRPPVRHAPDRHTVVLYAFDTEDEGAPIHDVGGRHHDGTPIGKPHYEEERR